MDTSKVTDLVDTCTKELSECVESILDTKINSIEDCRDSIFKLHKVINKTVENQILVTCAEIACKEQLNITYNNKYLTPQLDKQKPTAADLTAYAENEVSDIQEMVDIHNTASKVINTKLDNAYRLLNNLEKLLDTFKTCETPRKILNE